MMDPRLAKLVVDLETCAIDGVADYIEEPSAPSNYKDPVKIAEYIEAKRRELVSDAALDCDLGRIAAIGWMLEGRDSRPRVVVCQTQDHERQALTEFWQDVRLDRNDIRRLISFNGLRFDLPYLMRRSLYLDLPAPWLSVDRYRSPHLDLLNILTFHGTIKAHSLLFYAKRFGLSIPEGAAEVDGSMIQGLVNEGSWDAIGAHCDADVSLTYDLACRLRLIEFNEDAQREQELADAVGF